MHEENAENKHMNSRQPSGEFFIPWANDAVTFLSEDREKLRKLRLIEPSGLAAFDSGAALVVCGDRGTGKSLVLARKAAQLKAMHGNDKNYVTLTDKHPFVNQLFANKIAIPVKQYRALASPIAWVNIWRLVLLAHCACLAIRKRDVVVPRDEVSRGRKGGDHRIESEYILEHYFSIPQRTKKAGELDVSDFFQFVLDRAGRMESISDSLTWIIIRGFSTTELDQWINIAETALLRHRDPNWQMTIFVDAIDEAVGSPTGTSFFQFISGVKPAKPSNTRSTDLAEELEDLEAIANRQGDDSVYYRDIASQVWLYAQTGFITAADGIRNSFQGSILVYGAIRREAGEWIMRAQSAGKSGQKLEGAVIAKLEYDASQLYEIFKLNVDYTHESDLFSSSIEDTPSMRLFGFEKITHSCVFNEKEEILSQMIRHTFLAPRQLVGIAAAAKGAAKSDERKGKIREIVDAIDAEVADMVFPDYVASVMPLWSNDLEKTVKRFSRNVFTKSELAAFEEENKTAVFDRLYSRGLVGIPKRPAGGTSPELFFLTPNGEEQTIPEDTPYVVIHPALSSFIVKHSGLNQHANFYSSDFIVGEGLSCPNTVQRPLIELSLTDNSIWTFCLRDSDFSFEGSHISDFSNDGSDNPSEAIRASNLMFAMILLAMKRNRTDVVTDAQVLTEAKTLEKTKALPSSIRRYSPSKYLETHLSIAVSADFKFMNNRLRSEHFGVSLTHAKHIGEKSIQFSIHSFDPNKEQPKQISHGPVIPHDSVRVRILQQRLPVF